MYVSDKNCKYEIWVMYYVYIAIMVCKTVIFIVIYVDGLSPCFGSDQHKFIDKILLKVVGELQTRTANEWVR